MLCSKISVDEGRILGLGEKFVVERKLDGIRAYVEGGRLYDRRGKEITRQFPEFVGLSGIEGTFDGEIVAASGEFNDVSGRVHLRDKLIISLLAKKHPARFVIFDVVMSGTIEQRRSAMEKAALWDRFEWCHQVPSFCSFEEGWDKVQECGWEGLILKRKGSTYQEGVRSQEWKKCKAFSETTAVFTKLEVHNRGCHLETADGRSVNVNGAQAEEVKQRFKRDKQVICEVQYLPQKDSVAWRFPSFRGLGGNKNGE